jgi:hypothetical protein
MIIDEHGRKVYRGQEALDRFAKGIGRLMENRKLHYHTSFQDIPVSVENRRGSVRSGTDPDGDEWRTKMKVPYGYIPGTKGADGDGVDVFVGGEENAAYAYIVHCNNPETGDFDEDKAMLGFRTADAAKQCFLQHYDDPEFFGGMDTIPMWKFREKVWVKKHTTRKLVASRAGMQRSILGHHQDIMRDPQVREHGVKGMKWGAKEIIEKAGGKYRGAIDDPRGGKYHLFDDPSAKHGSTLTMHERDIHGPESVKVHMDSKKKEFGESREHGVQGMKWGDRSEHADVLRHARDWNKQDRDRHEALLHDVAQVLQSEFDRRDQKKESQEHGVKGMKWGVRHARHDAAGQKGAKAQGIKHRDLSHDPRTLSMMQHVQSAEKNVNAQPKTGNPNRDHDVARQALVALGWKVAESVARLAGVGGLLQSIRSVVQTPTGQKMFLHTGADGGHQLTTDKHGRNRPQEKQVRPPVRARASRESRGFEERLGAFLREAKRKPKVYYARSLQRYDTAVEAGEKQFLREEYPQHRIDFPRTRRHAELGMGYFHDKIDEADEVVITPFRGKHVTAGVFSEAQHALHKGIPVRVLRKGKLRTVKELRMVKGGNPGGQYARIILKTKSARKKR